MASIIASAEAGAVADEEFRAIQELSRLLTHTRDDVSAKLDDDGMLALQIALELEVSAMEEIKTPIMKKLDPGGKSVTTRKTWKIISAEWHASCKPSPDFVRTTTRVRSSLPSPPLR